VADQSYITLSAAPPPGRQLASVVLVPQRQIQPLTGHAGGTRAIEEFDSYETNFALESGCWSIIRATNHAAQPREIRPNTRVKTKAVTGRSPKPAAGRVAATKGGSQHMNRIPVSPQGITEVGYHEDADSLGTLELKFSNGGVYEFFNVPTKMYDEFMHAPSREDYYRANIGKRFPCTRVG
jgi:hypothetical protein